MITKRAMRIYVVPAAAKRWEFSDDDDDDGDGEHITVMACFSANGVYQTPHLILKLVNQPKQLDDFMDR